METVNEGVEVEVLFGHGQIKPVGFAWRDRRYEVRRVTMRYERKDRGRRYLCFAVDTGGMVAELVWDRDNTMWRLGRIEVGG